MNTAIKTNPQLLDIEAVLSLFDLPDYDDLSEYNIEYIEDSALYAYAYRNGLDYDAQSYTMTQDCAVCDGDGFDDELVDCVACSATGRIELDIEEIRSSDAYENFLSEAEDPIYKGWKRAVETVLDRYLEYHDLKAVPVQVKESYTDSSGEIVHYTREHYQIKPVTTWKKAAVALTETINGYGWFWFDSAWEFVQHGPYISYKQAVLTHLPSIAHYGEVYGVKSPQSLYNSEVESNLRYL